MPKTFVIGDIHGAHRALLQCLERSGFDRNSDHLICLGDVCDGWPDTRQCIDELLQINHLTYLMGNHDMWLLEWMTNKTAEHIWLSQGGAATVSSYAEGIPPSHTEFLKKALPYFLTNNRLFVHAGIDPHRPLDAQDLMIFAWDRTLVQKAWTHYVNGVQAKITTFGEVFIGHTPIPFTHPIQSCEVWMMDTGAGWSGVLSIMNVDTKESFTSDAVPSLYPGIEGRMKRK